MTTGSGATPRAAGNNSEELEAAFSAISAKLSRLRDQEQRQEALKLVGRHFKYRNCYSCPQKPSDYWWLYVKVIGVGDFHARAIKFQTDKDGKMEVEIYKFFHGTSGYVEITAKEYNAAWRKFQKKISEIK